MSNNAPVFVDGLRQDPPPQKSHPKVFHKKSRTGCQQCRTRRVKCDEAKPICRNCERQGTSCVYDRREWRRHHPAKVALPVDSSQGSVSAQEPLLASGSPLESRDEALYGAADAGPGCNTAESISIPEPSETRARRMLELELLQFYMSETGPSVAFDKNTSYALFARAIPRMALKSDGLLYTVFAFACLHRTKATGGDVSAIPSPTAVAVARDHYRSYLQLALQHHHLELAPLSRDNVDGLIMTANLLRLVALSELSERNLVPYTPPSEWLRTTRSHAQLFRVAWDMVGDDGSTQTAMLIAATPVVWDVDEREGADKRRCLLHILQAPEGGGDDTDDNGDPDEWDPEVRQAYESTLSYVGGIWQSVLRNEPLGPIGRRLVLFPILANKRFIELVEEARPRALVVMAHYFALFTVLRSFWYIGNTGPREVRAIAAHLLAPWQRLMEWPLHIVEGGWTYNPSDAS